MKKISLNGVWSLGFIHPFTGRETTIPAEVPGEAEAELERQGILPPLLPVDRADTLQAVSGTRWHYERTFSSPVATAGERVFLVFEGVDLDARILLNGTVILTCCNALVEHTVEVTGQLAPAEGENRLAVEINPDADAVRRYGAPSAMCATMTQGIFLRKARHVWGWDNAPVLPAHGIWRSVFLEVVPEIRWEEVYVFTKSATVDQAEVGVCWRLALPETEPLSSFRIRARLSDGDRVAAEVEFPPENFFGTNARGCFLKLSAPRLWFPIGYGEAFLYDFTLELLRDGELIAEYRHKFGVRVMELRRSELLDEQGRGEFQFVCNGEKIYIRGTNWKVADAWHSRSSTRIPALLALAEQCNCNMIRIWGGGVYEPESLFDWCDRHGMLVWQDFMFACEVPPHSKEFEREVAAEAVKVIRRLRNHPSLAVWCGDNEGDNAFLWGEFVPPLCRPSDNRVTRKVLRDAVLNYDPWRDYLPSSPYLADGLFRSQSDRSDFFRYLARVPEQHYYTDDPDFPRAFDDTAACFISETGPFWFNALSESADLVAPELARIRANWDVPAESVGFGFAHQKREYLVAWIASCRKHLTYYFGESASDLAGGIDALVSGVNVVVAETFKYAIEKFRREKFRRSGLIWWSLCDMWPMGFNYSVVDFNLRPKLPFYWIKASQQARVLLGRENWAGNLELTGVNDTLNLFTGSVKIFIVTPTGRKILQKTLSFEIPANSSMEIGLIPIPSIHPASLFWLEWEGGRNHILSGSPPYSYEVWNAYRQFLEAEYRAL